MELDLNKAHLKRRETLIGLDLVKKQRNMHWFL
jgi:hypothetical protein